MDGCIAVSGCTYIGGGGPPRGGAQEAPEGGGAPGSPPPHPQTLTLQGAHRPQIQVVTQAQHGGPVYRRLNTILTIMMFFSDANLECDKFLKSLMDEHGWVPVSKIADFNRVRHLFRFLRNFIYIILLLW
jgi:hypothetical protein